jgi:two-component system, NtrC family, response regulator
MGGGSRSKAEKAKAPLHLIFPRAQAPAAQERNGCAHERPFKPKLLIVEDDEGLQRQLRWAYDDYEVLIASDARGRRPARAAEPPVVTLDLGLPPDPTAFPKASPRSRSSCAEARDQGDRRQRPRRARKRAQQAIARGAYDFYQKPVDIDQLGLIVRRAFQLPRARAGEPATGKPGRRDDRTVLGTMITAAPEMLKVARTIERVANTNVSVMLLGASGTGKELLARGLHEPAAAAAAAFVAINCAAIPENLLEAELFGTRRAPSPARSRPPRARSSWPRAARCSSTRSATSRCRCRSSCCASCRSG